MEWLNHPSENTLLQNLKIIQNELFSAIKKGEYHRRIPFKLNDIKSQTDIVKKIEQEINEYELTNEQKSLYNYAKKWLEKITKNPINEREISVTTEEQEWFEKYQLDNELLKYNPLRTPILFFPRKVSYDIDIILKTLPPATQLYKFLYNIPDNVERCRFCSEYLIDNNLHCEKCHRNKISDKHQCNYHFKSIIII